MFTARCVLPTQCIYVFCVDLVILPDRPTGYSIPFDKGIFTFFKLFLSCLVRRGVQLWCFNTEILWTTTHFKMYS